MDFLFFEDLILQGVKNYNSESGFFSLELVRVVLGILHRKLCLRRNQGRAVGTQICRLDQEHKVMM
jgi:hypothetical protein